MYLSTIGDLISEHHWIICGSIRSYRSIKSKEISRRYLLYAYLYLIINYYDFLKTKRQQELGEFKKLKQQPICTGQIHWIAKAADQI